MLYDYLCSSYKKGEPIFLNDITGYSKDYIRYEMKKLTDEGRLKRVQGGVYYLPYKTILGTEGKMSFERYIEKKYLLKGNKTNGYPTGMSLANLYGFSTQNPSYVEIRSNEATTSQRKISLDGRKAIVYMPCVEINEDNKSALMFLDLMTNIDLYSELTGKELKAKLRSFVKKTDVNFDKVKEYISYYPYKVYKNIYDGGLMGELV